MKKLFFWFIVSLFLFGCAKKPNSEKEPNGSFNNATKIQCDRPVKGLINSKLDKDYYRMVVPLSVYKKEAGVQREKILRIDLSEIENMDLTISVFNSKQEQLKICNDMGKGKGEVLTNIGVEAEKEYFIKVEQTYSREKMVKTSSTSYKISFKLNNRDGNESEPNDKKVRAIPLSLNKKVKGYFNPAKNPINKLGNYCEEDWYIVKVNREDFLIDFSLSGVPHIDSIIEIYDKYDYNLTRIDNYTYGEGESYSYLATGGSNYTILVKSKESKGNSQESYILKTYFRKDDKESENEPNNNRNKATNLSIKKIGSPGQKYKGYINPKGDVDWYKLKISGRKHVLAAMVTGVESIDTILEFRDEMGNLLNNVNNMGLEQTEVLSNGGLIPDKNYYLVVRGSSKKETNARQFYNLNLVVELYKPEMELEPNNIKFKAQEIKVGKNIKAYLSPVGDQDWFKLNVYSEVELKFSVTAVPRVSLTLNIYGSQGEKITCISGEKETIIEKISRIPAGDCYIHINAGEDEANVRDKYVLSVVQN